MHVCDFFYTIISNLAGYVQVWVYIIVTICICFIAEDYQVAYSIIVTITMLPVFLILIVQCLFCHRRKEEQGEQEEQSSVLIILQL